MEITPGTKSITDKIDQLNKQAWDNRVNDSSLAHVLSKEAFNLAEDIDYTKGRAEGYRTFAFSLIRLSQHQQAIEYCEKAMPLFLLLDDADGQASIYGYHGIIQRNLGNYASSLEFLFKFLEITKQIGNKEGECLAGYHLGITYKYLGDNETALTYLLTTLSGIQPQFITYKISKALALKQIGIIYFETGDFTKAIDYYYQSLPLTQESGDKWGEAGCMDNIGHTYLKLKTYDMALELCLQSLSISQAIDDKKGQGNSLFHLGLINKETGDLNKSSEYLQNSLAIREAIKDKKGAAEVLLVLAEINLNSDFSEQSAQYTFTLLDKSLETAREIGAIDLLAKIHLGYYEACKYFNRYEEALTHIETHINLSKQIHSEAFNEKIQNLEISFKVEKSRQEAEIYRLRNIELVALYEESKAQKEEIEIQKKIAVESLKELKEMQSQLIQREKMASLGELTAGIAHEIQNPLNFVNNFSEVSVEIIAEMEAEINAGNNEETKIIAGIVKQNLEKIIHHGKRADAIVKGMLQHSHMGSGQKEPTNINDLADEYLRLSYNGFRAVRKLFNSNLLTDFDDAIDKINIVPQDIGRVILNLFNNAFYAVAEKMLQVPSGYEPEVSLSTKKAGDTIIISIRDNGNGIPQKVLDKIFQPFFTTKPTGQGTGLGLSLSYDIISKRHKGELKVNTKEGEYKEFVILLPIIEEL